MDPHPEGVWERVAGAHPRPGDRRTGDASAAHRSRPSSEARQARRRRPAGGIERLDERGGGRARAGGRPHDPRSGAHAARGDRSARGAGRDAAILLRHVEPGGRRTSRALAADRRRGLGACARLAQTRALGQAAPVP